MRPIAGPVLFPDAETRIVQIRFVPTYLYVLEGVPPDSSFFATIGRWAEGMWGPGAEYHLETGPERSARHSRPDRPAFHRLPLTVLVELTSKVLLPGADNWDVGSCAKLVYLTKFEGLEDGLPMALPRCSPATGRGRSMLDFDQKLMRTVDRAERRPSIDHKIADILDRAEERGRRVTHIAMHPNAYRAWWDTEIPAGDNESLEWAGVLFTKDNRLRGGKFRVRTEDLR